MGVKFMNLPEQVRVYGGKDNRVNAVIVTGEKGTVVVDTHVTLEDGQAIRQMADQVSGPRPLLALAITHEHFDHIAGNQFFNCNIISSEACRYEIIESREGLNKRMPGLSVTPPNIAYKETLLLSLGDLTMHMKHEGGHCPGESSIFIPELGTLISGDLVFNGRPPFVAVADFPQWITALTRLYAMDPEIVIPGHGQPGPKSILIEQRAWLENFMETTLSCRHRGLTPEEACAQVLSSLSLPPERREMFLVAVNRLYGTVE